VPWSPGRRYSQTRTKAWKPKRPQLHYAIHRQVRGGPPTSLPPYSTRQVPRRRGDPAAGRAGAGKNGRGGDRPEGAAKPAIALPDGPARRGARRQRLRGPRWRSSYRVARWRRFRHPARPSLVRPVWACRHAGRSQRGAMRAVLDPGVRPSWARTSVRRREGALLSANAELSQGGMRCWTHGRKRGIGVPLRFAGEALPRCAGNILGSAACAARSMRAVRRSFRLGLD